MAWARRSPEAARSWVAEQGDPPELVGGMVSGWLAADPTAASEWAGSLEGGAALDAAAESIARSTNATEPETAFAWGLMIEDATKREETLRTTVQAWIRTSPEAAREALQKDGVPESLREAFLN